VANAFSKVLAHIRAPRGIGERSLAFLAGMGVLMLASMYVAALAIRASFTFWFVDTGRAVSAFLFVFLAAGAAWDLALIEGRLIQKALPSIFRTSGRFLKPWHRYGFFRHGIWPALLFAFSVYLLLATSNICLLHYALLNHLTHWHDQSLWVLEEPIFLWLAHQPISVNFWTAIYGSFWLYVLIVFFIIVVWAEEPTIIPKFCISLVLLFYLGRLIAVFFPVMAPAYYRPELFMYLDGTPIAQAIKEVLAYYSHSPNADSLNSVVLGGSLTTFPSLHVATVALASLWLAKISKWTLLVSSVWFFLNWVSTLVLGQHYLVDGTAGVVLALGCAKATTTTVRRFLGTRG
jgi:membrane-associated phospholipid phosphatase